MKTDELRERYLAFFESKGHRICESDVLVPTWDPSVLFTPAGMNQFKDHFLGKVKLDFTRAASCQKCLRTGDIENVGRTAYHHTFFEMLGNFSFGDYFKREAIEWAWEFCTSQKWLGIDPERLSVTVYLDDDESAEIWANDIGVPSNRIGRMGEDENFWPANAPSQGPDGVCGPCSEIFYRDDFGETVEIWNLVFTQFNRVGDPPDNLRPLPSCNIDTGMGLERTAAAMQGVRTNYHIDILRPIVERAAEICGQSYDPNSENGRRFRRIADHVRACAFAVHENVYPGAKGEKYVIRRLLRRAVLDGRQMGVEQPFLFQLVPTVGEMMKKPYPELLETMDRVARVIEREEESFFSTLDAGLAKVDRIFSTMEARHRTVVDGNDAAELYSTYGIPPELVESLAIERNFTFDTEGFRQAMIQHGIDSGKQQAELFKTGPIESLKKVVRKTPFEGYDTDELEAEIRGIIAQGQLCDTLRPIGEDEPVQVVLDRTPFYAEAGGQTGDTGEIAGDGFLFRVSDTQLEGDLVVHMGCLVSGEMSAGAKVKARVDRKRRQAIRRAHSATHLLHHALQKHLGRHAQQQGSKVDSDWLRFDFTHLSPVPDDQIVQVEQDVKRRISAAEPVRWQYVSLADAREKGAMMLFGEKYPDPVRLVSMGEFSRELCGGTHVDNTQDIGEFEVLSEESVSTGTRRILALTGEKAREHAKRTEAVLRAAAETLEVSPNDVLETTRRLTSTLRDLRKKLSSGTAPATADPRSAPGEATGELKTYADIRSALRETARLLNVAPFDVPERLAALLDEVRQLEQRVAELDQAGALSADTLIERGERMDGIHVVICEIPGGNANLMRQLIDQIRKKTDKAAVLLAAVRNSKVTLVAGLSRDVIDLGGNAGNWVKRTAAVLGGGGGGRPDMAQAGGKSPEKLPEALQEARLAISSMLQDGTG
ncbi:MAG: alanine--tRNA ligase [Pirellulaceae bacterium]